MFGWLFGRNKAGAPPAAVPSTALGFALLDAPVTVDAGAVLAVLAEVGGVGVDLVPGPSNETATMFTLPGGFAAIATMPAPIPAGDLEGPARDAASGRWPEAVDVVARHRAHLIVHVRSDVLDRLDTWLLLSKLVAAASVATGATCVYWAPAAAVWDPKGFAAHTLSASREAPPLLYWLSLFGMPDVAGVRWRTKGLDALGHPDLEIVGPEAEADELPDYLFDIAGYLLSTGAVLGEGHTLGRDAKPALRVTHGSSAFGGDAPVARLTPVGG